MTDQRREVTDLERAPERDEIGNEADQYEHAEQFGDEGAGPDRGEN